MLAKTLDGGDTAGGPERTLAAVFPARAVRGGEGNMDASSAAIFSVSMLTMFACICFLPFGFRPGLADLSRLHVVS